jgi:hypothetical protein
MVDKFPYHQIISEEDEDNKEVNEVMSNITDMGMEFVDAMQLS